MMEPRIEAFRIGPAPVDYRYIAEQETDSCFVSVICDPESLTYQVTKSSVLENEDDFSADFVIEQYDKVEDTAQSKFFRVFLELDRLVDKKIEETRERIIDTKYYDGGIRLGGGVYGKNTRLYAECFNTTQPEHKEYLQIIIDDDGITYTASHESYYAQYEFDDMYSLFFGEPKKEEYYIKIHDLKELDQKYWYFASTFRVIKRKLIRYFHTQGLDMFIEKLIPDEYEPIITCGKASYRDGGVLAEIAVDLSRLRRVYISISDADKKEYLVHKYSHFAKQCVADENGNVTWGPIVAYASLAEAKNSEYGEYFSLLEKMVKVTRERQDHFLWRPPFFDELQ